MATARNDDRSSTSQVCEGSKASLGAREPYTWCYATHDVVLRSINLSMGITVALNCNEMDSLMDEGYVVFHVSSAPTTRSVDDATSASTLLRKRTTEDETLEYERMHRRRLDVGEVFLAFGDSIRAPIARLKKSHGSLFADEDLNRKEQAKARANGVRPDYKLTFWGCMVAGAVSRR